jgi:hypothetical protein
MALGGAGMKTVLACSTLVFGLVLTSCTQGPAEAPASGSPEATRAAVPPPLPKHKDLLPRNLVREARRLDYPWLLRHASLPLESTGPKEGAVKDMIARSLIGSCGLILKKEFVPSIRECRKDMVLVAAAHSGELKKDVAYVRYRRGEREILAAYSKGPTRLVVLMREGQDREAQLGRSGELLKEGIEPHGVVLLSYRGGGAVWVDLFQFWYIGPRRPIPRLFPPARWFRMHKEIAVEKERGRQRAREIRAIRAKGEIHYFRYLMKQLPEGDKKGKALYEEFLALEKQIEAAEKGSAARVGLERQRKRLIDDLLMLIRIRSVWPEKSGETDEQQDRKAEPDELG